MIPYGATRFNTTDEVVGTNSKFLPNQVMGIVVRFFQGFALVGKSLVMVESTRVEQDISHPVNLTSCPSHFTRNLS